MIRIYNIYIYRHIYTYTRIYIDTHRTKMPVTTRHQLKKEEMQKQPPQIKKNNTNHANHANHANIDFEDASKEWRKNKIKHDNCCFTYVDSYE